MRVKGVTGATVDLKAGRAEVTFDPDQTNADAIAAAITAAGFPAKVEPPRGEAR